MPEEQSTLLLAKTIRQNEEMLRSVNILLRLRLIPKTPALLWHIVVLKAENRLLKTLTTPQP